MSNSDVDQVKAPDVTLLKSELEAAAARVAERAMNNTVDGVTGLLSDTFGGWIGDPIKQWRTRRLIDALAKTKDHLEAKGIPLDRARALPMGELYMMFDSASKQDDPQLTDMWAALLSNAMNPDSDISLDPSLIRILENLSGLDAAILDYLSTYEREKEAANGRLKNLGTIHRDMTKPETPEAAKLASLRKRIEDDFHDLHMKLLQRIAPRFSDDLISLSLSNLLRSGLINDSLVVDRRQPLITILKDRNRDGYVVEDRELKDLLQAMIDSINARAEDGAEKYSLTSKSFYEKERFYPSFNLSGLGKRLIAACT